jgi:hypothetical protein
MREVLVGAPRDGSEPVLAVAVPGPDVEAVRWGFDGDPVHLVRELDPHVRRVYFSNGPPPVEAPDPRRVDEATDPRRAETPLLMLLLCD